MLRGDIQTARWSVAIEAVRPARAAAPTAAYWRRISSIAFADLVRQARRLKRLRARSMISSAHTFQVAVLTLGLQTVLWSLALAGA